MSENRLLSMADSPNFFLTGIVFKQHQPILILDMLKVGQNKTHTETHKITEKNINFMNTDDCMYKSSKSTDRGSKTPK